MILADTSLLIVLGRLQRLDILENLFGQIVIPPAVYREAVLQTKIKPQADAIKIALKNDIVLMVKPNMEHAFNRRLGAGEIEVLSLAMDHSAQAIIMDDRRARNEATELGLKLFYTADILKAAEKRQLISSYANAVSELAGMGIFLPE